MGSLSDEQKKKMEALQDNLRADAEPLKEYTHIGERGGRRLDGYKKAGGRADYTIDVQLPGMLYMRFLDSPYPHAKVLSINLDGELGFHAGQQLVKSVLYRLGEVELYTRKRAKSCTDDLYQFVLASVFTPLI